MTGAGARQKGCQRGLPATLKPCAVPVGSKHEHPDTDSVPVDTSAEVSVGMTAELSGIQARLPSTTDAFVSVEHVCLYRRVSTRVRFGVWSPDGRSTPVPPSLVADP